MKSYVQLNNYNGVFLLEINGKYEHTDLDRPVVGILNVERSYRVKSFHAEKDFEIEIREHHGFMIRVEPRFETFFEISFLEFVNQVTEASRDSWLRNELGEIREKKYKE